MQTVNPRDKNAELTAFVSRLYQICLGRTGSEDTKGLDNWIYLMLTK